MLVENAHIAILLQVQLQALQFHALRRGHVVERKRAEIGLAGARADGCELRADYLNGIFPIRVLILERFEYIAQVVAQMSAPFLWLGFMSLYKDVLVVYSKKMATQIGKDEYESGVRQGIHALEIRQMSTPYFFTPPSHFILHPLSFILYSLFYILHPFPFRPSMTDKSRRPAVVLLSGGLDSTTTAAIAQKQGFALYALSVDYGQRHCGELDAARRVASALGAHRHVVVAVDLRKFGGSALTDAIAVPKDRDPSQFTHEIPVTYVPARNTVLLSLALAHAEVVGAADIFIGVNAVDYSGYPDCRPKYIAAFARMAQLATKAGVEGRMPLTIHAPLIKWTKAQIIRRGLELGVDYSLTQSCYDPDPAGLACGRCDACLLRLKGFAEAGERDPVKYIDAE
jgi:7-cyano-7-deazaguanine synthase